MMIVSNEGFALWARPSAAALRSGLFIRTKNVVFELPPQAIASARTFSEEAKAGIAQPKNVWRFPDAPVEMCVRSERYDQEITLLHFEKSGPAYQEEAEEAEDTFDRFQNMGRREAT
jgi:hypothetical protein